MHLIGVSVVGLLAAATVPVLAIIGNYLVALCLYGAAGAVAYRWRDGPMSTGILAATVSEQIRVLLVTMVLISRQDLTIRAIVVVALLAQLRAVWQGALFGWLGAKVMGYLSDGRGNAGGESLAA